MADIDRSGRDEKTRRMYRRMPWFYGVVAACLLITAIAGFSQAGTNRPLRYYTDDGSTAMTYYTNGSGNNTSFWGINTDNPRCEFDINGTVCINGSSHLVQGVAINGTLISADGNNYPTALSVNQTGSSYSVVLARSGLGSLMGNFSVSGTGGGIGYVNTTGANFNSTNWFIRMINDTTAQAAGVSCNAGDAISTLSNNSVCTSFITPAALSAFGYISSAPNVNVTGFTGSGTTVQLNLSNGSILNATVTGGSGTGNISYNGNGTAGYIPRITNSTNMNNSGIYDDGRNVTIGQNVTISANGTAPILDVLNAAGGEALRISRTLSNNYINIFSPAGTGTPAIIKATGSGSSTNSILIYTSTVSGTNISRGDVAIDDQSAANLTPAFFVDVSLNTVGINTSNISLYPDVEFVVNGDANITGVTGIGGSLLVNGTNVCLANGTNCAASGTGTGNATSNGTTNYVARFTNGTNIATGSIYDNGTNVTINSDIRLNNLLYSGRISSGEPGLKLWPVESNYGYTQIAFYPESNASHTEGDVLFNVHKREGTTNNTHEHFSIYTTGDDGALNKRFDLEYNQNLSDWTVSNIDIYSVEADRITWRATRNNTFTNGLFDWGQVQLTYDPATNSSAYDIDLEVNGSNGTPNVRLYRNVNLNNAYFTIYKGDNTTNSTFQVNANSGDISDIGNITTSTGSVNDNRLIRLNGNRAIIGYNGSSTNAFLQAGSGKAINLQTDGANSRLNISSTGNVSIDGNTLFVNAGSNEVNMTANVGVTGSLFVNNTQVCLQNGSNCPAGGSGNVTASNGTAGYVGVFSSASNLVAMLINSTMIGDAAVNATHLYTSNGGSAGQVLTLNSTGGMNWSTPSTGTSTSGGNASINGDGVFGTYTIQKNTTEIVSGNLTENGVLRYPNNATFSKYLNIGGTVFPYNQPRRFKIAELEFLRGGTNTGGIESLGLSTFSSGASTGGTGDANHPGVLILQDSATALGGSGIFSDVGAFLLAGGENFTVIFQIRSGQTGNSTTKIGFHDVGGSGWATDGCYWSFDNWGTGTGGPTRQAEPKCASNSAQTKTTNFTYTNNTWYVGNIYVNPTATNVTFTIMNETGGVLQSDSITSNIPTAAGRETGAGVIFTQNTTSAAAPGVYLDYLSLVINRELNRGLQQ